MWGPKKEVVWGCPVQGFRSPVPTVFDSGQAGFQPSIFSNRSATIVESYATKENSGVEMKPTPSPWSLAIDILRVTQKVIRRVSEKEIRMVLGGAKDKHRWQQPGMVFQSLAEPINELCKFIKQKGNIRQNIMALIRHIKLSNIRALKEKWWSHAGNPGHTAKKVSPVRKAKPGNVGNSGTGKRGRIENSKTEQYIKQKVTKG